MTGVDEAGIAIDGIKDPQGGEMLRELASKVVANPNEETVAPFLHQYFGAEVGGSSAAAQSVAAAVAEINREGTAAVLERRYLVR
mmetsp:Transcript_22696/g.38809  ORF Transcript_22696/g.38809 Transcript_22696/m.38809 type:complete len:85 (-) Transcript_22696:118-372(-)